MINVTDYDAQVQFSSIKVAKEKSASNYNSKKAEEGICVLKVINKLTLILTIINRNRNQRKSFLPENID